VAQCFGSRYLDPVTLEEQDIHECIVACPHEISPQAIEAIAAFLDPKVKHHVSFLAGDRLSLSR
jgi:hypothetical protein